MPQVYGSDMDELPPGSLAQNEPKGMRWKKRGHHEELEFVEEGSGGQDTTQQSAMQRYCLLFYLIVV